jgi:nitrite reductase/ring-hydroxylating ferredoxin subunit
MAGGETLTVLCAADDVKPDQPARAEVDGNGYAVFVVDGQYYVTQDQCTHGPGSLSEGFVEGCEVECPFHQGKFDIKTGLPSAPPCSEALRVWEAQVVDGKICIDPAAGKVNQ